MSDFTDGFWSLYVAALTILSIIACALLLWITARKKIVPNADNTTGHVWDEDLREANNPMPRWWVGLFIITIIYSIGYLVVYPGLGSYAGTFGWSTAGEHAAEISDANKALEPLYAKFEAMQPQALAADPKAMAIGERLFMNNCAQCHGSDARGSKGFPNLTDADWLHGGTPEQIVQTITKGRIGQMPVMAAAVGTPEDVRNLAHYVLSLSGSPSDSVRAQLGKEKFTACAACHGVNGKGNQAIGAPNLTDDIWLHGWGEQAIVAMINNGKLNQMPAQEAKLTSGQIKVLGSYIWGLSNKPGVAAN